MGENLHKSREQISRTAAELIQFPQNSLYRQTSSVLLPCPPHRISPFWEKEYQSRTELMSLLHQTSSTSQSSHRQYHKNVQEPTSWLKHSGNPTKMPHLNYRAVAAPLPRLHHLTKPGSRHKHRTVAPVLPLPRTDIPAKKTPGPLIPIDQCLIPPLGLKHQYDFPSDSDHRLENSSGSDHLPKIFPACDHLSIEDLSLLNPKDPTSTFSDHQTKIPLYKSHKSRDTPVPDTQIKTSSPLARPPTQGTKVLPRPRRRIKATNALLGLFNLDPVLHPLAKSLPFTNWTNAPTSSPNHGTQTQALKASHSDLQLREAMSFLQYLEHRPRPLAVPTSHLNRKNRPTTVCKFNNRQLHGPCPLAHVSVQTEQDNWETKLLRKYLLDSRPCSPEEKPLTMPLEPSTLMKIDKEPFEAIFQGKAIQDIPPSNLDLKTDMTSEPTVHVSIQTEPDTWVTISQRLDLQEKLPSCPDLDTDMISEPIVHVSIQTELDTWETISPETDFQETFSSSPDVDIDITPEPTVHVSIQTELETWEAISPETELQETLSSSPDLETDKTLEPPVHASMQTEVDNWESPSPETDLQETLSPSPDLESNRTLEPPIHASMQTELDTWETISPEIDQEEIFGTGQDENIIPLDSSLQDISGPHQRTTPPSSPTPGAEHTSDSNALVLLHQELEQWKPPPQEIDHLAIFSSSLEMDTRNVSGPTVKESVPMKEMYWEIILAMLLGLSNHQAITLDEKHETAPPLDLDDQERILSSPDETKTPLPSPNHQIEDISNPDAQATLKQKLEEWATLSEETNLCNTLAFTTESNSEKIPVLSDLDDHISDGIEKETIEIIDIMPLRIESQEANQIVEDHWAITPLSPDNSDQENAVPALDHQLTPILSLDHEQEAEDTAHDLAQDLIVPIDQESGEITPLGIDLVATIPTGQDNEATMPPVDLKPKEPTQLVLESQFIPSSSPDQKTKDIPDPSSQVPLQPGSGPCDTMSSGTELQNIILGDQDQRITPPLNLDNEETTLLSFDQCTTHPPSPDKQSEVAKDLNTQATFPRHLKYSAKVFEGQEYDTPPPTPSPSITISSISENETESGTESTNVSSTSPGNVDDEEEMPPSPDKTISSSSSNHQIEAPTGRDHQPETELSSDHQNEVESGLPHQLHSVQKKQTKLHLNYIKPYTIEGGTICDKTAHAIINSIPRERIKNDICKDIPFPLSLHECNSCEYVVCLICASWIPDGCPHEGMKYPCEAQLLAVPIPIPMCEKEIDIKFVFKCPEATVSSLFSTSSTHSYLKKSSESFISDTMLPVPSRPKWFHFILGKSLPQWKKGIPRSPEPLLDKVFEEGSISKEGEKAKTHRTSFRSLLERFQWRQKETK
ncbi:uncharacterized protein LOC127554205 isoform X3 [Antechinus flavipes]|uniref:uncharacterized protein LOC127554205 isoform X3 n=1 Tax=Antechinus flavipes TaxID=38775 RepID=UPI00223690AC|nr:uncharacterized protein LOC127554205 isoform X3 [Antechinus flavipes]